MAARGRGKAEGVAGRQRRPAPAREDAAAAQQPARYARGGLWGDFGWGIGWATVRCEGCAALPADHPYRGGRSDVIRVAIGYALRSDLLVAFRGGAWSTYRNRSGPITAGDTVMGLQQVAAAVSRRALALRYFPGNKRRWVEAGIGLGQTTISRSRRDPAHAGSIPLLRPERQRLGPLGDVTRGEHRVRLPRLEGLAQPLPRVPAHVDHRRR